MGFRVLGMLSLTASMESQILYRKILGGPRSPLRFGGDDRTMALPSPYGRGDGGEGLRSQ
jgi:hypothetical protein